MKSVQSVAPELCDYDLEPMEIPNFRSWRINQFKNYLRKEQQNVCGRKCDLDSRAEGCFALKFKLGQTVGLKT